MLYFAAESPVLLSPYLDISGCVRACVSSDQSAAGGWTGRRVPVCESSRCSSAAPPTNYREINSATRGFMLTSHRAGSSIPPPHVRRLRHHFIPEASGVPAAKIYVHPTGIGSPRQWVVAPEYRPVGLMNGGSWIEWKSSILLKNIVATSAVGAG